MEKRPCPSCATPIGAGYKACPHCGRSFAEPVRDPEAERDAEHLRLLSIFHKVLAGLAALFGTFPLIHVTIGLVVLIAGVASEDPNAPPWFLGLFFVVIGGAFVLYGWTKAVLLFLAGRFIAERRRHGFCIVVAAISCAFVPFGTILGVFTLITLNKPAVKALFDPAPPPVSKT